MSQVTNLAALSLLLTSCSADSGSTGGSILNLWTEEDSRRTSSARWEIEIWTGPSITGPEETNHVFIPNTLKVLQDVVDRCDLGQTFFDQHTDGVASLVIVDPELSGAQISCIRAAERLGLRLRDKRINS